MEEWVLAFIYGAWAGVSAFKHPDRTLALGSVASCGAGRFMEGKQGKAKRKKIVTFWALQSVQTPIDTW